MFYRVLLAGLCFGLSFPFIEYIDFAFLAWGCLVPLIRRKVLAISGWYYLSLTVLFSLVGCLVGGWWILGYDWLPGAIGIVWHGLLVAVPLIGFFLLAKHVSYRYAVFTLPFLWVAWEWPVSMVQPLFWGILGASQSNQLWLVQFADLTGVWGVSFWVVSINVVIAWLLDHRYEAGVWKRGGMVLGVLFLVPLSYSLWQFHTPLLEQSSLKLGVMRSIVSGESGKNVLYATLDELEKDGLDLVVWPESVFEGVPADDPVLKDRLERWKVPVLMAFLTTQDDKRSEPPYAGAVLMGEAGQLSEVYHKQRLIPHAEYPLFPADVAALMARSQARTSLNLIPGHTASPLLFERNGISHKLGILICYEAAFPQLAASSVYEGASALFVLANDDPFGFTESWQAASFARLRAIETRRPVVRASTSGVIGVIDPHGAWQSLNQETYTTSLYAELPMGASGLSWYVQYPHAFPVFCFAILVAGGLRRFLVMPVSEVVVFVRRFAL